MTLLDDVVIAMGSCNSGGRRKKRDISSGKSITIMLMLTTKMANHNGNTEQCTSIKIGYNGG